MTRNILASFAAILTIILLYSSCTKIDTTDLGNDLIPGSDNVETKDTTLDVITDNLLFVNDTTKMLYTELHSVGIIDNDAEFGGTAAQLYSSFVPSTAHSYPFVKRDTVQIDSVVLSLSFSKLYGDSNSVQQFEVREISPIFNFKDTGYYLNNPDIPVREELLGSKNVSFLTLNDSVQYRNDRDTIRSAGELRISLDTAWARHFVDYDTTPGDAYNNDSLFMTKFRGLEVRTTEGSTLKRALAYFNINDNTKTRITFYCRIQSNGKTDTIAPYFMYTARSPEANIVKRTPSGNYLANVNNGLDNDDKLYLQSTPGSYAKVTIPGLSTLGNRVIHRAELIAEKMPSDEENYYVPAPYLFVEAFSQTGDSIFTVRNDFVLSNSNPGYNVNTLGGLFKNDKYVFNLTRYVQSIVTNQQTNYALRISTPFTAQPYYVSTDDKPFTKIPIVINPTVAGGRVVLYGGNHPDVTKHMRLHIYYSKI
ncbi:MAG TPA: DUF4270 family protein [Flavitalea sp.]|nr:DUF4270 family protein [Flavitalea sp.]